MAFPLPMVEGVEHRFVEAGETSLHVASAGEGEPVLLVHGWPEHWYCWRLVIPRIAERYRVIAVDLRGLGWSDIAWEGFEKESMADDLLRLLDALGIDSVRYVGHDWGAWIGFLLALREPRRIRRLLALSAPAPWIRPTPAKLLALHRLRYQLVLASPLGPRLVRRGGFVEKKIRRWSVDRTNLRRGVQELYARDVWASTRARATSLLYRSFLRRELGPVLAGRYRGRSLEMPSLLLHGAEDPVLPPRLFEGLERGVAGLRVEAIEGAGHFLPEERPELVAERALCLFGEPEPGPDREPASTRGR